MKSIRIIESTRVGETNREHPLDQSGKNLAAGNQPALSQKEEQAFGGLLVRRYRWVPSFKAKLLILLADWAPKSQRRAEFSEIPC